MNNHNTYNTHNTILYFANYFKLQLASLISYQKIRHVILVLTPLILIIYPIRSTLLKCLYGSSIKTVQDLSPQMNKT